MGQGQLWLIFVFAINMLKFSNGKELFTKTGLEAKKSSHAESGEKLVRQPDFGVWLLA